MIDWERVNELRDEVGAEDFRDVVDIFLDEVEGVMNRLRAQTATPIGEGDLHLLKGCALNLGFQALIDICEVGERRKASGNGEVLCPCEIVKVYEASKTVFLEGAGSSLCVA